MGRLHDLDVGPEPPGLDGHQLKGVEDGRLVAASDVGEGQARNGVPIQGHGELRRADPDVVGVVDEDDGGAGASVGFEPVSQRQTLETGDGAP